MVGRHLGQSLTRIHLVSLLLSNPKDRYYIAKLAKTLNLDPSAVRRELLALHQEGILLMFKEGGLVHFQADASSPLFKHYRDAAARAKAELVDRKDDGTRQEHKRRRGNPGKNTLRAMEARADGSEKEAQRLRHENEELELQIKGATEHVAQFAAELDASRLNEKDLARRLREAEAAARRKEKASADRIARLESSRDAAIEAHREEAERAGALEAEAANRDAELLAVRGKLAAAEKREKTRENRLAAQKSELQKLRGGASRPASATIRYGCSECGQPLETADANAGRQAICPHCNSKHTVPRASSR